MSSPTKIVPIQKDFEVEHLPPVYNEFSDSKAKSGQNFIKPSMTNVRSTSTVKDITSDGIKVKKVYMEDIDFFATDDNE